MDNHGEKTLESMSEAGWYNEWLLSQFSKYLKGEILEVGCGIGNFTEVLTKFGQVTAVDINKSYIVKAKVASKKAKVGYGDIEKNKYFFNNQKFDSIVCINILEHIKNDRKAIQNLANLLNKNGSLIIIVPSHQMIYGEIDKAIFHYRRYDKVQLNKVIIRNGLSIIKSKRLNFLGTIGWFIAGKVMKNKIVQKDKIRIFNILGPVFLFFERFIEPPIGISIFTIATKK